MHVMLHFPFFVAENRAAWHKKGTNHIFVPFLCFD